MTDPKATPSLIERLRALSRYEHDDLSLGNEAADALAAAEERARLAESCHAGCAGQLGHAIADLDTAEAKIAEIGRQLVIETDKRMQAEIRLAAYENNEGMPERPKRYRIETESTEGEFVGAKDYEALRAFAAKQAVDAGKWRAYDERKRRAIAAGQGRSPLRNAAIDAAKGK